MAKLQFRIVGASPLVMHNGQLADPLNEWARAIKEISSKRKKVDADLEEMARVEWMGSLYLLNGLPCIPGYVFEAALIGRGGAARKERMGKQAAAGLIVNDDFPLEYDGPTDLDELWKDERFRLRAAAVVQSNKVMRTRPIFREWAANIEVLYTPSLLNGDDITRWVETAGVEIGLMDWRPKFGRFDVVK